MRALFWTNRAVIAAACVWVAPRLAVARPWRPPARQPAAAVAADKPDPVSPGPKTPKAAAASHSEPLTIAVVGDQVRITGDPEAVAQAYQLGKMILEDKGQNFRAFRLQYATSTEVAEVLDEWFNGTPPGSRRSAFNPLMAVAFRGRGGRGLMPTPPPAPQQPPRIHVVADPDNNTLLVRGSTLDLVSVQRVLKTAIDVPPPDSAAAMKPFVIGPLQYAIATEVVKVLKDVYQEDLDQATVPGARRAFRGRRPQQPLDPSGRPRPVALTLTADDRTNSIIGMAPARIADGVKQIAAILENKARVDTKSVEVVPTNGIDPDLLRDVVDAIQARPPRVTPTPQRSSTMPLPSRR